MAEEMKFVVVGHHTRLEHAQRLAALLDAHLLIDDGNHGANWNHRRALEWAAEQPCRVVVLEDDAMPVAGFTDLVGECLNRFPDSLVSFYLGTGRPPQYQMQIAERLIVADKTQADYITLPRLISSARNDCDRLHQAVRGKPAGALGAAYQRYRRGGDLQHGHGRSPCW